MQNIEYLLDTITTNGVRLEQRTLLWINPNPSASFAEQTVALDLSDYDDIEVEFSRTGNAQHYYQKVAKSWSTQLFLIHDFAYRRSISVSTTGVTFGAGQYGSSYPISSVTTNNNMLIPQKIYGIKYINMEGN